MGHYVEYVLDIPGRLFLDRLGTAADSGEWWEGTVPGSTSHLYLVGNIDGLVTPMTFADIKYSWLIAKDAESLQRVHDMDQVLRQLFPKVRIVRLDELLLNEWIRKEGESFLRQPDAFDRLLEWLMARQAQENQEDPETLEGPKHWELLNIQ